MIREVIGGVVLGVCLGCSTPTSAQPEVEATTETRPTPDCQQWNTRDYFDKAIPQAVAASLEAGADPNFKSWLHQVTPLHHAASIRLTLRESGRVGLRAMFEAGETLMGEPVDGRFRDFEPRSTKIVKVLLKAGADPNAKTLEGVTPLHEAADADHSYMTVELLLKAGADPMARDHEGNTPLHLVASGWNVRAVELLLKAGADPNARDIEGNTPLHRAADWAGDPEIIKVLQNAGADLMVRNEQGNTPLHEASQSGYVNEKGEKNHSGDEIEALLDAGADPTARNGKGQTPRDLARDNEALKGSDAFWSLNDARFQSPGRGEVTPPMTSPTPAGGAEASEGGQGCQIPGYPRPADVQNLGLPWCPASVGFQVRAFALQAAGAQCALSVGGATPQQAESIRKEIRTACDMLEAWGEGTDCKCPPGFGQ